MGGSGLDTSSLENTLEKLEKVLDNLDERIKKIEGKA
jgi:hypothetical protein